jgi:glycosyltransferase involved in cell wall biosynthesis
VVARVRGTAGIDGGRFVIVTSGFADGPAQPLRDHLLRRGARDLLMVSHPLVAEHSEPHTIVRYIDGAESERRRFSLPNRPPFTFAFDPFVPLGYPRADAWFGFNCLATAVGLSHRAVGRVGQVVHWSVDFVPERFSSTALTRIYESVDAYCCRNADARVDLSEAALHARSEAYGLGASASPAVVVPMGAWLEQTPKATTMNFTSRRVVFMGHLVPRMGVDTLFDALELLVARNVDFSATIIGGGPLEAHARDRARSGGLEGRVACHGFVADRREMEALVSEAAVGVAPYDESPDSFSRFADPGKLKVYLGAGLPIVLTDVPPNARELAEEGGAEIVRGHPVPLADALQRLFADEPTWQDRHEAALRYASRFDWTALFDKALPELGIGA